MSAEQNQIGGPKFDRIKPDGRSKYEPNITLKDGMVSIAVRQVERKWLPISLFGRVVLSRMVRIAGPEIGAASLVNHEILGLVVRHEQPASEAHEVLGPEWPVDFRQKVSDQITRELHRSDARFSVSIRGTGAIAVAALALYLIIASLAGPKAVAQPAVPQLGAPPALSATEVDAMSSAGFAQKAAESSAPLAPLAAVGNAKAFVLRPAPAGGKIITVWSDPLCPHCRDFEQKVIAKLPVSIGVTVIPVAFKHGARPVVSSLLCTVAPAARANRWADLMAEQPSVDLSEQCPAGPEGADLNSGLFARAGLQATPTIMKPDGSIYTGDKDSVEQLVKWVGQP